MVVESWVSGLQRLRRCGISSTWRDVHCAAACRALSWEVFSPAVSRTHDLSI